MGIVSDLKTTQTRLFVFTIILYGVLTIFFAYYPLAKQFEFTYFSTPALFGVPVSDHFVTLDWWVTSLYVVAWFPVLWVVFMLFYWKVRGYKTAFIIYLAITLAWFVCVLAINIVYLLSGPNDPLHPDNPAGSYRRCCTPEFYTAVPECPNFERPMPACNPPIALGELGVNGPFIFQMIVNAIIIVIWIVYLVLTLRLRRFMDTYEDKGGDSNYVAVTLKKGDDNGTMLLPKATQQQQPVQGSLYNNNSGAASNQRSFAGTSNVPTLVKR